MAAQNAIAQTLLEHYGQTFAEELDIDVARNSPKDIFQLLTATVLFSARIQADIAIQTAKALSDRGWVIPEKLADSSWDQRVEVLDKAGYTRYRERMASMLGDIAQQILEQYEGDLRRIRQESYWKPDRERERLKEIKGIGDTGADIFMREVQVAWDEMFPFIDERSQMAAEHLNLPTDIQDLLSLVDKADWPRLVAALVRVELNDDYDRVLELAKQA